MPGPPRYLKAAYGTQGRAGSPGAAAAVEDVATSCLTSAPHRMTKEGEKYFLNKYGRSSHGFIIYACKLLQVTAHVMVRADTNPAWHTQLKGW